MNVEQLHLGPIVGHTDSASVKVWGRAARPDMVGVARYRSAGSGYSQPQFFAFNNNRENVGVVIFEGIDSDEITYQIGCLAGQQADVSWENIPEYTIRLLSSDANKEIRLVFGSCRHQEVGFVDHRNDELCFEAIADRKNDFNDEKYDLFIHLGDQVYIDHNRNPLGMGQYRLKDTRHHMRIYEMNYSRPYFRKVTSQLPNYMMMDDHEVLNNWSHEDYIDTETRFIEEARVTDDEPPVRIEYTRSELVQNGLDYYENFQALLAPGIDDLNSFDRDDEQCHYWHEFSHGCADFFMMDVRFERGEVKDDGTGQMLSARQFEALKNFLNKDTGRIKVICSPVPMAPDGASLLGGIVNNILSGSLIGLWPSGGADRWDKFSRQRQAVFELIRLSGKKVMILSGDVHCSWGAKITHPDGTTFYQLTSSGFNWPIPGVTGRHFIWDKHIRGEGGQESPYFITNLDRRKNMYSYDKNNFCHLTINQDGFVFSIFDKDGRNEKTYTEYFTD